MPSAPSPDALHAAREALAAADPALARAHAALPPFAWRLRPGGFEGLFRMIVEQQVSVAAAASIWRRVGAGLGEVTPERLLAHAPETLRSFGLSGQKARYGREIALAQVEGRIDLNALAHLDDDAAVQALTAIKGVGRWTAETYLMFCEGRVDVFPGGDVALQAAMAWLDGLEARPTEKAAYVRAEAWSPHRGVAAHLLWAWYGAVKRGEAAA
ncbi:MAG: DNA-3-methyladenine glycosylase 2 family protein [Brevundimonas sp.]|jgi:DNA-3-methyladenine glycosylase II|uniref:DNA-3-methyladenine glycosylase family protein n=1 Tax=Brevundimonas sp. TaxID=1871086 RepID=UPI0022C2DAD5|nr:DNA-3-methyladenine glycosylase 2 family protein [Brevundimonas sp.]MCZ8088178.1 DNA-3-methyladenine glycosylase 2 family protein [Brevundimonas sp.]MCZ8195311.1 DNA-3-methyladenine glycosylase 2 family protein [Brevundimonas sp.]